MNNECALKGMGWVEFTWTEIRYNCTRPHYTCPYCKRNVCMSHSIYKFNHSCVECITRRNLWYFDIIQESYNQIYSPIMTKACKQAF